MDGRETVLVEPVWRELHYVTLTLVKLVRTVRNSVTFRGERLAGAISAGQLVLAAAEDSISIYFQNRVDRNIFIVRS